VKSMKTKIVNAIQRISISNFNGIDFI